MTAVPVRLSDLLRAARVRPESDPGADPEIRGIRVDSRTVSDGDLFCALRGEHVDATTFVPDAVDRGAVAILADGRRPDGLPTGIAWIRVENPRGAVGPLAREVFGRPDASMVLVGITGTNGKTTVAWMVEAIARAAGMAAGRIGTIDAAWRDNVRPAVRTTPEAPELYGLLDEMRAAGTRLVAIEVSSHALDLGRVGGMHFSVAAFLNLGRDHLDFHGDPKRYFDAKARLFEQLGSADHAVVPDDDRGRALAARSSARATTFGRSTGADVRITAEDCDRSGGTAVLVHGTACIPVRTRLLGRFQLDNAAAAAGCALAAGLPPEAITAGIASLERVPGRAEPVLAGQPFGVWIDYAHTEEALAAVLGAARELADGRVLVAFGCGGDRDRGKRGPMGACAARRADVVVLTSDNPRTEDPHAILDEIEAGARATAGPGTTLRIEPDRRTAIHGVLADAAVGDIVVIAGKGHEIGQTTGSRTEPFDDREAAAAGLAALGYDEVRSADA